MDNIKENLLCPISLDILIDPISVPCCGKSFSRENLIAVFDMKQYRCPTCRHVLNGFDPRTASKNIVIADIIEECAKTDETIREKLKKQKLAPALTSTPTVAPIPASVHYPNINNYLSSSMVTPYHYLEQLKNRLPNSVNYTSTQVQALNTISRPMPYYSTTERTRKSSRKSSKRRSNSGGRRSSSKKSDRDGCIIQ